MFDTVIIGGGPAGTGLLLKALKDGAGNKFMAQQRIALFERSSHLIKGNLTNYKVNSDTFSDVFLECLDGGMNQSIEFETLKKEIEYIRNFKGKAIPLEELKHFYEKLGALLEQKLNQDPRFELFMNTAVTRVVKLNTGSFKVYYNNDECVEAKKIVLAAGAAPTNISGLSFSGKILLDPFLNKSIHSDELIRGNIPAVLRDKLSAQPKVVILGGSHSAFSAAHFLLNNSGVNFNEDSIKIWCKTKPKIYFPDTADALKHGYSDFNESDVCPVTNKLYRLAGLRMDGRTLYMQMLGLGNCPVENRVSLKEFKNEGNEFEKDLWEATLIVMAFGYKLNIPAFYNEAHEPLLFKGMETGHWVDESSRVLDHQGGIIPNVFASGLATGFIPSGVLGGEPSFEGQTNGIWYYQNAIAELIQKQLLQVPSEI